MRRTSGETVVQVHMGQVVKAINPPVVGNLLLAAQTLWTRKNWLNVLHWLTILSAIVVAVGSAIWLPGHEKMKGYGVGVMLISVSQVIHKFADTLEHQATLTEAVAATLPLIQAAASGSVAQEQAVKEEVNK